MLVVLVMIVGIGHKPPILTLTPIVSIEPFAMFAEPIKDELAQINAAADSAEVHEHLLMDFLSSISNRLSNFFGKGWSNDFLVEHTGLEPVEKMPQSQ